jgi:Carbon monoxide dehydrogenase subunit alpha N-terminal domain
MGNLPQIPGARKKGVILLSSEDDFKKLDDYLINDTVCIGSTDEISIKLAKLIHEKYKVSLKLVATEKFTATLSADVEIINSPIKEIVGEGRAEAVKFNDGKAIGVSLVIFIDKAMLDKLPNKPEAKEMDKLLIDLGTKGASSVLRLTRQSLDSAIAKKGESTKIEFPETNYYLPLINALLNIEVKTLKDCSAAFHQAEGLVNNEATASGLMINSSAGILNKGVATLICEEILAALAVLNQEHPKEGLGFIPDKILRSLGLQLVDGRISGVAVILGPAKDEEAALYFDPQFSV